MKKFSAHLQYAWWRYALVAVAAILVWTTVFAILAKPDANEKLTVSCFGDGFDWQTMQDDVRQALPQITGQYIEEVSCESVSQKDNLYFYESAQTRLYSSDILIFAEGTVTDTWIQNSFPPMAAALVQRLNADSLYTIGGVPYGVILTGADTRFAAYFAGEGTCIAFFGPYSENLGAAYGSGKPQDDGAVSLLAYLLENVNG